MRRKPMDVAIDKYRKYTDIRKVHPLFFFEDCDKCGDEVKREPMWRAIIPHMMFSGCRYIYGCTTCFPTKKDFNRKTHGAYRGFFISTNPKRDPYTNP